uniref:Uncharacterized protein n=1 Tax=Acrobeloides nanus TaxID=290746 RepID=A0A914D2Q4_9BILA
MDTKSVLETSRNTTESYTQFSSVACKEQYTILLAQDSSPCGIWELCFESCRANECPSEDGELETFGDCQLTSGDLSKTSNKNLSHFMKA